MRPLVLIFLCTVALFSDELKLEHNFDQAVEKAQKQHKQVLMMYSAVWCPECNYMKDVVFKDKAVSSYMQKHYVVLTLDIQKDKLPDGFEYPGIPVFFLLGNNAKEKHRIVGGSKAKTFLQKLKGLQ